MKQHLHAYKKNSSSLQLIVSQSIFMILVVGKMGCLIWVGRNRFFNLFFILSFIQLTTTCLHAQLCPQDQSSALLRFKKDFSFNKSFSSFCDLFGIASYPKLESWKEGSDCCSWDGVECDRETARVIGLDLSCSWLHGTIHPNSSTLLFSTFPHLQRLNLAFNNFSNSPISSVFNRFTRLTHLNLSQSSFSGEISSEISSLSKLTSLDLSGNDGLRLKNPGFQLLVQNLTQLRELHLDHVNISSVIPNSLLNLTSLTSLSLLNCRLHGKFPDGIFHLPNLNKLILFLNYDLTGHFPKFNSSSPLQYLDLGSTNFSGELPNSIGNMKSLNVLYLDYCKFSGSIPASFGYLTQITTLYLVGNAFNGSIAPIIPNLRNLVYLSLGGNNISDPFLPLVANLTQLVLLGVSSIQVAGPLPSQVSGLQNLATLRLRNCSINDTIPSWVFTLPSLVVLDLSYNKFTGHMNEFQSNSLERIDLSNNKLQGTIPVPPPPVVFFSISDNKLTGEIPSSFCSASSLEILNLSNNSLSGAIPHCLGNFSKRLLVLDLQKNSFSGTIPNTFAGDNSLTTINFNGNGLEGPVPKSLVNCTELEVLDLGNNKISGKFPHWLENLNKLHVLILRSNGLHGPIMTSKPKFPFPNLRVIDISYNNFTGPLPTEYFGRMTSMMNVDEANYRLEYIGGSYYMGSGDSYYQMTITMKGSTIEMEKVLTIFAAIDFSKNEFEGEIPMLIGNLNSIRGLNLSHNNLSGKIPTSIGNLTKLEWLDLSSNKLTGKIPQQLTTVTFLAVFNVSQNQLSGPIPPGKQFDTFSNDSYSGNFGLCGLPLSKKCNNSEASLAMIFQKEDNSEFPSSEFDWKATLMGYGCGMVFGLSMGYLLFSTGKPKLLVKIIEAEQRKILRRSKKHAIAGRHRRRRN